MRVSMFLFALIAHVAIVSAIDFTNSIGMEFVSIQKGSFYMGSCDIPECESGALGVYDRPADESPQHAVSITQDFQIGVFEVTLGQFMRFVDAENREDLLTKYFLKHNSSDESAAVTYVSWDDTQDFIKWLNEHGNNGKYRLPTEAEWEYAARAGTKTTYYWGDSADSVASYAWCGEKSNGRPHIVGQILPNPWGLYDVFGNESEWVQDLYDMTWYSSKEKNKIDPLCLRPGMFRSLRGCNRMGSEFSMRSARRGKSNHSSRWEGLGFRIVREP